MKTLDRASRVLTLFHEIVGEWILVDDRHVERVGTGEPPSADRTVDLPGATILPGFIDSHVHLTGTGINLAGPRLDQVQSAGEMLGSLREAAQGSAGSLLAHGFDETKWADPELPSLADLDETSAKPLIAVRTDGHLCLANRPALEGSGALDVPGAELDAEGHPTGVLRRQANDRAQAWFHESLTPAEIQEYQLRAAGLAAARGVTCVHEMALVDRRGPRDFEVLMAHRSQLPVDVVTYAATTNIGLVIDYGLSRIGGDLSLDGSIGARTALLAEPYADGEGTGAQYFDLDYLCEFLHNAHLANLQVSVHAIGDGAVEQILVAWERVYLALDSRLRRHFRARRHRVEHFEMPTRGQIERAAVLGVVVSAQPAFDAAWGGQGELYERRLGPERAGRMNPFKMLLERGITVGGGSDSPITPLDPMAGIMAAEGHHDANQRLSREEAIRMFTYGSAALSHLEEKKASLEPGKQADFAAYEVDPTTAESIRDLRPIFTVSLGREVYAR